MDTLNFSSGSKRIRQVIKYEDYKQFGADVQLTFGDEVDEEDPELMKSPPEDPNKRPNPAPPKKKKGLGRDRFSEFEHGRNSEPPVQSSPCNLFCPTNIRPLRPVLNW